MKLQIEYLDRGDQLEKVLNFMDFKLLSHWMFSLFVKYEQNENKKNLQLLY